MLAAVQAMAAEAAAFRVAVTSQLQHALEVERREEKVSAVDALQRAGQPARLAAAGSAEGRGGACLISRSAGRPPRRRAPMVRADFCYAGTKESPNVHGVSLANGLIKVLRCP